jgi:two-component system, cell cycle sensor histidine kinase and response regulator CckA
MKIKFRNLLSELQVLITVISMAIVIGVVGTSLLIISHNMLVDLRNRSADTADEMQALLEYPLYAIDDEQAVRIGETFLSSGKISGIVIESAANGVILSKTTGKKSLRIPQISRVISRDGLLLGKITIMFSDQEIIRTQSRFEVISLIIIIAVLLANILANRFIIARRVRRPFNSIISGIGNISEGKYGTNVDPTPYRDLNILVSLFNDMAGKINLKNQEQKRVEDALRESEHKYRELVENANSIILRMDIVGKITFFNEYALRFFGFSHDEVIGRNVVGTIVPLTDSSGKDLARMILDIGVHPEKYAANENENICKDGTRVWVSWTNKPILDDKGRYLEILCIGNDITYRKRADELLQKSEQKYRTIVETTSEWIWEMDLDGRHTFSNPGVIAILGYHPEKITGQNTDSFLHAEDQAEVKMRLPRLIAGKQGWKGWVLRWRHKDGTYRYLESNASPIISAAGELVGYLGADRDITDRMRADEALKESERKARAIFDLSFGFIGLLTPEGALIEANRSALEFAGVQWSDVSGKLFWETPWWTHSPDLQKQLREAVRIAACGELVRFEATHLDSGGKLHAIDFSLKPVKDEKGLVVLLIPEGRDISERKKAEEALAQSELRFRSIIQSSSDIIVVLDKNGNVTYESPSASLILGYEPGFLLGRSPLFLIHPEDLNMVKKELQNVFEGTNKGIPTSYRLRNADGSWIYLEAVGSNQLQNPAVCGIVITARDITVRMKFEGALRASEERYRQIANCVPELIWIMDLSGNFTYVNSAVEHTYGWTVEEFLRLNFRDLVTPQYASKQAADLDQEIAQALMMPQYDRNSVQVFESEEFRKDGSMFWTEVSAAFLWSDDDKPVGIIGMTRDITQRKRAEEEKSQLNTQLMQAQKMESVGRLAGGVAHDFNNMLSAILGYAEIALIRCAPSDPLCEDLKAIKKAAQRSAELTRQLLAFARKQTIIPRVLDVNETVAGMLKMLMRLIGEEIDLVWMPGAGLWPVKMDPSQIDQIMVNLCVNARDAVGGAGKITIETENTSFDQAYCAVHPGFTSGEYVMVAVSDNGCGITKEVLEHLFEPFYTTKDVGKGTGLGLATIYGIIKQNNGFINVYSEPGNGTTFKIYLPRLTGTTLESSQESVVKTPKGNGELILLVEDEPMILDVSRTMLETLGYEVLAAGASSEALRQAEEHAGGIHLLITDVVMPEMNGRDLSKLLAEIQPGLKCLFTSGYTANAIAHHGIIDEGVNFIQKPFSLHNLAVKIREVLGD